MTEGRFRLAHARIDGQHVGDPGRMKNPLSESMDARQRELLAVLFASDVGVDQEPYGGRINVGEAGHVEDQARLWMRLPDFLKRNQVFQHQRPGN